MLRACALYTLGRIQVTCRQTGTFRLMGMLCACSKYRIVMRWGNVQEVISPDSNPQLSKEWNGMKMLFDLWLSPPFSSLFPSGFKRVDGVEVIWESRCGCRLSLCRACWHHSHRAGLGLELCSWATFLWKLEKHMSLFYTVSDCLSSEIVLYNHDALMMSIFLVCSTGTILM